MKDKVKASCPGINKSRILNVVNSVLPKSKAVRKFGPVFVSPQKMRQLNKKYRDQDKSTNVLSFEEGDVVLCPKVIETEAKKYGFTQKNWMTRLVVHGILHLAGYDHSTRKGTLRMERVESVIARRLGDGNV